MASYGRRRRKRTRRTRSPAQSRRDQRRSDRTRREDRRYGEEFARRLRGRVDDYDNIGGRPGEDDFSEQEGVDNSNERRRERHAWRRTSNRSRRSNEDRRSHRQRRRRRRHGRSSSSSNSDGRGNREGVEDHRVGNHHGGAGGGRAGAAAAGVVSDDSGSSGKSGGFAGKTGPRGPHNRVEAHRFDVDSFLGGDSQGDGGGRRRAKKQRKGSRRSPASRQKSVRSGSDSRTRGRSHTARSDGDGGGSSDASSDRDDTVGHFEGGPGTLIANRYQIVRDVGMGTFGRVVECLDLIAAGSSRERTRGGQRQHRHSPSSNDPTGTHDAVAIKIVRNVKRYHESALIEADIVEDVNRRGGRGRSLCAQLLNRFDLPQGHYCLVFECLGRSLYDFLKEHDYRPFPLYCVRDFATQLLDALDFLHGFGLIHTDLKPENILLTSNDEVTYRGWDGTTQRVPASTKIKVIDFGGATYDREKKSSVINTRQYRAPEVILGLGWSTPSDLWSAGCIIAELYLGELLFATHDNVEHLALMERAVGPFPRDMIYRASSSSSDSSLSPSGSSLASQCFDSYGYHRMEKVLSPASMSHVRRMGRLETLVAEHDRSSGLVQLLGALLTIDPNSRATAGEALKSHFCSQVG